MRGADGTSQPNEFTIYILPRVFSPFDRFHPFLFVLIKRYAQEKRQTNSVLCLMGIRIENRRQIADKGGKKMKDCCV